MNIPASAPGSAAPRTGGQAGPTIPSGSSSASWHELLTRQLQAGESAGPPSGKSAASPPKTANGATASRQSQQPKSGFSALLTDCDSPPGQGVSAEEDSPTGTTTGQARPRAKRVGSDDEATDAMALTLAFPFQPAPKPLPLETVAPEAGSDDHAPEMTTGSRDASGEFPEIQLPSAGIFGPETGLGKMPLSQLLARSALVIPQTANNRKAVNPESISHLRSGPPVAVKDLPVEAASKATPAPSETKSLTLPTGWEKVSESTKPEPVAEQAAGVITDNQQPPAESVEIRGTPGAPQESTMKSGREQSEIAGWFGRGFLTRQNSPGDGRRVQAVISTGWRTKHAAGSETDDISALSAGNPALSGTPNELSADAKEVAAAPVPLATHIAEQAIHFKSSGLNSMAVVLKPDPQTEIRLEFATRDGQIEARAHVTGGDLQQLGSNWTQLQDSLAQQGIRLLPLSGGEALAMGTGAQGDGAARRELPQTPENGSPAPQPSSLPITASTASNLTVRQHIKRLGLLDSWA